MSPVIEVADKFEANIREFLRENKEGGKYLFEETSELTIPLMVFIFVEEGWNVEFDFDEHTNWLEFKRKYFDEYTHSE